ncbi:MAG: HlyD family efflux transporter periplasmic adaptor subunit [Bryobacterales bacterium]|nr:HlyD family efflux transporter periplasmic adaptor subunit [Bryobacterales bacterium]
MPASNAKVWAAAAAGAAILMAAGYGLAVFRMKPEPAPEPVAAVEAPPARPEETSLPGTIRAVHVVDIPPPLDGTIEAFYAETGDQVYEGQILGRMGSAGLEIEREAVQSAEERARERMQTVESQLLSARLEASRARADASRSRSEYDRLDREYRRQKLLYSEGATPKLAVDKVERDFELAKGEFDALDASARISEERVTRLMRDLDDARADMAARSRALDDLEAEAGAGEIVSPIDGQVISRVGVAGERVSPAQVPALFRIATDLTQLEVALDVPPPALKELRPGLPALVIVAGASDGMLGEISRIEGTSAIVSFTATGPARPGDTAQVRIKLDP